MFEVAEAYERQRGRSSKVLAPLFLEFAVVYGEVLDVGCGTGALTFAHLPPRGCAPALNLGLHIRRERRVARRAVADAERSTVSRHNGQTDAE